MSPGVSHVFVAITKSRLLEIIRSLSKNDLFQRDHVFTGAILLCIYSMWLGMCPAQGMQIGSISSFPGPSVVVVPVATYN